MDQGVRHSNQQVVAIVEDEPLVRDVATWELEDCGFRVVDFESADAALNYLKSHGDEVAVVLTDVQMPGKLNGLELADILSRLWPKLGLLITSGGPLVNPRLLPPGAKFIAKPWRACDMAAQVERIAVTRAV